MLRASRVIGLPASRPAAWRRMWRYYTLRLLRLEGTPEAMARGLSAGVFAGLFPIFGLQTLVGILLAVPLRGNKILAAAGTWVSNPFTYIPIFAFNYQVGEWLLGRSPSPAPVRLETLNPWQDWVNLGQDFATTLFTGCFVVGLVCAPLSYFMGVRLIRQLRHQRRWKRANGFQAPR
jgi:hypothetical protein